MRGQFGGKVVVSLKLEQYVNEALERVAREEGASKSEVIRRAIAEYLAKHKPNPNGYVSEEVETVKGFRLKRVYVF